MKLSVEFLRPVLNRRVPMFHSLRIVNWFWMRSWERSTGPVSAFLERRSFRTDKLAFWLASCVTSYFPSSESGLFRLDCLLFEKNETPQRFVVAKCTARWVFFVVPLPPGNTSNTNANSNDFFIAWFAHHQTGLGAAVLALSTWQELPVVKTPLFQWY